MANKQITGLTALAAEPADADELVLRDSDAGTDKRIASTYFVTTSDGTRVTFAGGGTGVTEAGTQTLTNKTLTTPTITLKQGTGPTPTAEGDIQWDTDGNFIVVGDGASQASIPSTTSTHTLTNKTLTTPTIGDFTNATHDHADAAGGGNTLVAPTIASFANADHDHQAANKGGALGSNYATLTGSQTLTNKTLTTPTIASLANATHDHADAAGGGTLDLIMPGCISIFSGNSASLLAVGGASYDNSLYAYSAVWLDGDKILSNLTIKLYVFIADSVPGVTSVELYNVTDAGSVTGSEVTHNTTTLTVKTSGDLRANLASGLKQYALRMKTSGAGLGQLSIARLVID